MTEAAEPTSPTESKLQIITRELADHPGIEILGKISKPPNKIAQPTSKTVHLAGFLVAFIEPTWDIRKLQEGLDALCPGAGTPSRTTDFEHRKGGVLRPGDKSFRETVGTMAVDTKITLVHEVPDPPTSSTEVFDLERHIWVQLLPHRSAYTPGEWLHQGTIPIPPEALSAMGPITY